jgi:hypothetical protein
MPRMFATFPAFRRFAALLALLAMLVPVASGLAHHPDLLQSFVHICGLDHGANGDHDKAPHKLPICPICQSQHLLDGGLPPPTNIAFALILVVPFVTAFPRGLSVAGSSSAPQARPRAPPLFT